MPDTTFTIEDIINNPALIDAIVYETPKLTGDYSGHTPALTPHPVRQLHWRHMQSRPYSWADYLASLGGWMLSPYYPEELQAAMRKVASFEEFPWAGIIQDYVNRQAGLPSLLYTWYSEPWGGEMWKPYPDLSKVNIAFLRTFPEELSPWEREMRLYYLTGELPERFRSYGDFGKQAFLHQLFENLRGKIGKEGWRSVEKEYPEIRKFGLKYSPERYKEIEEAFRQRYGGRETLPLEEYLYYKTGKKYIVPTSPFRPTVYNVNVRTGEVVPTQLFEPAKLTWSIAKELGFTPEQFKDWQKIYTLQTQAEYPVQTSAPLTGVGAREILGETLYTPPRIPKGRKGLTKPPVAERWAPLGAGLPSPEEISGLRLGSALLGAPLIPEEQPVMPLSLTEYL